MDRPLLRRAPPGGEPLPPHPDPASDFFRFVENLSAFTGCVPVFSPSVRAVYTSSRSFGRFSRTPARGEPLSYEEGHAPIRWLLDHPTVDGVWYGWGAYLRAGRCGTGLSNGGGVCYERSDFVADGAHPSRSGGNRIARLLHGRLLEEPWYTR